MSEQELLNVYLPKWPQMLVWGESVTVEQAKDIILRTDRFLTDVSEFGGGNNHRWAEWARDQLGFGEIIRRHEEKQDDWGVSWKVSQRLREELGYVDHEYAHNTWAAAAYIFGPYGWCHPDGTIWYQDNIGKWPSTETVYEEWKSYAAAFPYLDLTATLMSGEHGDDESKPLVSFRVQGGIATVTAPTMPESRSRQPRDVSDAVKWITSGCASRERGLPDEWIAEYGKRLAPLVRRIYDEVKAEAAA